MKKIFLTLILFFCLIGVAFAQNPLKVVVPDQSTIEWNAVTTYEDGTPIPTNQTVSYQVFLGNYPIPAGQDRNDRSQYMFLDITTDTTYTITFAGEGVYLAGVRAVRTVGDVYVASGISWSDDPVVTPIPWYYVHARSYAQPIGLRQP